MAEWIEVIILGIIEGITEFLPISSTGHLLIAQQWMRYPQSDLFLVVIQSGAVLAVVLVFQRRVAHLIKHWRESESRDYLMKLGGAFMITAVGGLILKALDFELPETALPVGMALLIGGIAFLWIERWLRGRDLSTGITWTVAAWVGAGQLLAAIFPGTSRSGATILIALLLGVERRLAVEFTFLLGVPTLLAAGALKIVEHMTDPAAPPLNWGMLALGTVVSGIVGFAAVRWLLHYLQSNTFEGFGWYRIAVGVVILLLAL